MRWTDGQSSRFRFGGFQTRWVLRLDSTLTNNVAKTHQPSSPSLLLMLLPASPVRAVTAKRPMAQVLGPKTIWGAPIMHSAVPGRQSIRWGAQKTCSQARTITAPQPCHIPAPTAACAMSGVHESFRVDAARKEKPVERTLAPMLATRHSLGFVRGCEHRRQEELVKYTHGQAKVWEQQ
jgi:hypothetical protein